MTNHGHLIIDPVKSDISKIMHCVNLKYAMIFNKKYHRYGHLFQDRFKSIIISNNQYLLNLTIYIHKNPCKIASFKTFPQNYKYSSLSSFIGIKKDPFNLLDIDFVKEFFQKISGVSRDQYIKYIFQCNSKKLEAEFELENQKSEYRSSKDIILSSISSAEIIKFVACKLELSEKILRLKSIHNYSSAKSIAILLMRSFSNCLYKDIGKEFGNISLSRVSNLCSKGIRIIDDDNYSYIWDDFIKEYNISK